MWHTPPSTSIKLWILVLALVACSHTYGIRMCDAAALPRREQETECTYNGSTCTCDYATIPGDSCTFTNAETCLGACEDPMESCNDECGEDYDSCLDRCVDIESFQCICNCAATQTDCRNTCRRAHISCTCGCAPSTKRPTRSPTTSGGTTSSNNNDSSVSGPGSKIHATAVIVTTVFATVLYAASVFG